MNKWIFGIAGFLIALGIFLNTRVSREKKFDGTVNYSPRTFRPYDTRFFFLTLKKYTQFQRSSRAPGGKPFTGTGKTYVVCSPYFLPDRNEKAHILRFVAAGNNLLLSSFEIDPHFLRILRLSARPFLKPGLGNNDSLKIVWKNGKTWNYPGSAAAPRLLLSSSHPAEVLASDGHGFPSLIRMNYGKGNILIQVQPMAFSNYFLLHKNNSSYLDTVMKELNLRETSVIWDDYYLTLRKASDRSASRSSSPPEGKSFFMELVRKHPPLQWAMFTVLAGTVLFILNYARRLRQPLDRLPDVKNNSLEFTRAIAGLYRLEKDNTAIAQKIRLQLQDHLYNAYRIPARDLVPENAGIISRKTGKPLQEVIRLTETLPFLQEKVSDKTLTEFYRLVYIFIYK